MPLTIWKLTLTKSEQTIELPQGAHVLTVREQGENICLWVKVNPAAPVCPRRFFVCGTGHDMPPEAARGEYLGTAMLQGGGLVLHVFGAVNQ